MCFLVGVILLWIQVSTTSLLEMGAILGSKWVAGLKSRALFARLMFLLPAKSTFTPESRLTVPHSRVGNFTHEPCGATGAADQDVVHLVVAVHHASAMHEVETLRGIRFNAGREQDSAKEPKTDKNTASRLKVNYTSEHWTVCIGGRTASTEFYRRYKYKYVYTMYPKKLCMLGRVIYIYI